MMSADFWDGLDPDDDLQPPPTGVCSVCNLTRSLTGACDCD